MKINCYYDFPVGQIWSIPYYFDSIYNMLVKTYPNITFEKINNYDINKTKQNGPCFMFNHHWMVIENEATKKFFVISYWDDLNCASGDNYIDDIDGYKWEEVFTSCGVHNHQIKYIPFSYVLPHTNSESLIEKYNSIDNKDRKIPEKLNFRGFLYSFREVLSKDNRFNVINKYENHLDYEDYISELNDNGINLSLNGAAEICFRDMEILGVGSALFREKLRVKFHDDLIPDYHYISYDLSSIQDKLYDTETYYKMASDILYERFLEVKNNTDYVNQVAKNGKEWYENNVPIKKHSEIAKKIINIKKLF